MLYKGFESNLLLKQNELWDQSSVEVVTTELGENNMPLAALWRTLRVKSIKKEDLFKMSQKERPNPAPANEGTKVA